MDPVELFTPEFKHDPFPTYRILRDHHPVYRDPRTGAWLLSRFEDVYAALADHEAFSSEHTRGADSRLGPRRSARVLVGQDQPGHTRIRRLVNRPLARGEIEKLEPELEALVGDLLDAAAAQPVDLVPGAGDPAPGDRDRAPARHRIRGLPALQGLVRRRDRQRRPGGGHLQRRARDARAVPRGGREPARRTSGRPDLRPGARGCRRQAALRGGAAGHLPGDARVGEPDHHGADQQPAERARGPSRPLDAAARGPRPGGRGDRGGAALRQPAAVALAARRARCRGARRHDPRGLDRGRDLRLREPRRARVPGPRPLPAGPRPQQPPRVRPRHPLLPRRAARAGGAAGRAERPARPLRRPRARRSPRSGWTRRASPCAASRGSRSASARSRVEERRGRGRTRRRTSAP